MDSRLVTGVTSIQPQRGWPDDQPLHGADRQRAEADDDAPISNLRRQALLLNVRKRMGAHGIGKIHGQGKNITTYNLARMNMLPHGVKDPEFEIYHGDTLTNDWDVLRELNPAKKPAFDARRAG